MKTETFPLTVTEAGVSAKIRKITKTRNGTSYNSFVVDYILLGERKQVWRSDLGEAKAAARDACIRISNGSQDVLNLTNSDRLTYLRATEAIAPVNVPLDTVCREYASAVAFLSGRGSITDAVHFFVKSHTNQLPKVPVASAVEKMLDQCERDGKSSDRMQQLEVYLNRFKDAFNCDLRDVESKHVAEFIVALPVGDRTKKNCRDVLAAFFQWCGLQGYLAKGTDMMERVQKYSSRKIGEIQIFTPDELRKLIKAAGIEMMPYIVVQAFAGIRGKEIQRLMWADVDLQDSFITVHGEAAKTGVRRLVPIKPNLKTWLLKVTKREGPICAYKNLANEIGWLAATAGVGWKKNGLRHSYISYRVAECGDVPRVADEAGNSVSVIRTNYLRRVKPTVALEWFNIVPESKT